MARVVPMLLLVFFLAASDVGGLQSVRSFCRLRSPPIGLSTSLFSKAILSPLTETRVSNTTSFTSEPASLTRRKSSFLHKQQTKNDDASETGTLSAQELRELARKNSGKTVGSSQYKKAWTRWLYLAVESIRVDLGESLLQPNADDEDPREVREAFEKLFFDLGVAADTGSMPSFGNADARKGYALEFFCRGRSLAEFLLETPSLASLDGSNNNGDLYPGFWTRSLQSPDCPILGTVSTESELPSMYEIVSLGGGPGFDFVGVAMAAAFSFHTNSANRAGSGAIPLADIHVTTMDYEEGWSDLVSAMDLSTRNLLTPSTIKDESSSSKSSSPSSEFPTLSCDWGGKCDITKSILHEPVNANCRRLLVGDRREEYSRLWICQYCVAENAKALRDSDYIFFKELVQEMSPGTLVLLTEVVPRLWPELVRVLDREGLLDFVDVGFRKAYSGKQFMIRKRETSRSAMSKNKNDLFAEQRYSDRDAFESLDDRTRDQLEHFERLSSYHQRKVDSGWKRQGRKANGSVYHEEQELRRRRSNGAEGN